MNRSLDENVGILIQGRHVSEIEIVQQLTGAGLSGTGAWTAWKVFGPTLTAFGGNLGK